ncbi:hypothetical protein Bbelb_209490 [Branchiostoma belcheri]|nr:hypothetical protein Bbelb_209490 [Branchiostoma belcheri]
MAANAIFVFPHKTSAHGIHPYPELLNSFGRSPSWEKIAETSSGLQEDFTDFNFWRAPLPLLSEDDINTVDPVPEFNDFNFWREPIPDIDLRFPVTEDDRPVCFLDVPPVPDPAGSFRQGRRQQNTGDE